MTTPVIVNAGQAFSLGATYGTPPVQTMPSEVVSMINLTGVTLFVGDIVALDYSGTDVILPATGSLTNVIGVVGNANTADYPANTYTGTSTTNTNTFPTEIAPTSTTGIWQVTGDGRGAGANVPTLSLGGVITTASNTITSVTGLPSGVVIGSLLGATLQTPYNATNNTTPQTLTIIAATGTTLTLSANVTLAAGSPWTVTTGIAIASTSAFGPGFQGPPSGFALTSTFEPNAVVPITRSGFARVNINGLTTIALGDGIGGTNAAVTGTRFAYASTGYASATGLIIATALEAYANRDSYLSNIVGITGHDTIRAIIGKM